MVSKLFSKKFEHRIFLDERVLYPEFVPNALLFRDVQLNELADCFRPLLYNGVSSNAFLFGPTGVGKTVSAKFVCRELEETAKVKCLYLNCFEYSSRTSVLIELSNFLGAGIPRRGLAVDEIFSFLLESLSKFFYFPLIVLDEVDQLLLSSENEKLLYDLLRVSEYGKKRIGLILISNDSSFVLRLDDRIKNVFFGKPILFEKYTPQQLKSILSDRAQLAFLPSAISDDVIALSAAHAAKLGGDARIAFASLLRAGRIAESKNHVKVSVSDLREAFVEVDFVSFGKGLRHLSKVELSVLSLIAEHGPLISGKFYELASVKLDVGERRLRDILKALEKTNLISVKEIHLGNKGKTREFESKIPKHVLEKLK
ncbi:MAG: AAA family ATPase [Candidatus Diapherotrites archaeon]